MRVFYFGCAAANQAGHFMYEAAAGAWRSCRTPIAGAPAWLDNVDTKFTPSESTEQGIGKVTSRDGWTILAWHDYTGDGRPNSNSAVIVDRVLDIYQMRGVLHTFFPNVHARQPVPVMSIDEWRELSRMRAADGEQRAIAP